MPKHHLDSTAMVVLTVLCLCWGLQQVAIKIAIPGISPTLQAGIRSAGSLLLLWGWSAWNGVRLFGRDGSLWPGLAAGLLFAFEFLLIFTGMTFTTASRGVIFLYTSPFIVALGAHLFVPNERMRMVQAVGLLCAFAGVTVAFADGLRLPTSRELIGDAMILLAAIAWGATTVIIKASRLASVSPNKVLFYQLGVSAITLPVLSAALGESGITDLNGPVLASMAYQIVIVAFASYLTWFWLIASYPAGKLTAFSFLTPLFGLIAGGVLLGERISAAMVAAMLLVCFGIYLVNRRPAAS
ncbi:MAG TPA: DMT family transporter [Skermanella sp.]|nr:DMT family transporter [Skermanella sp.]